MFPVLLQLTKKSHNEWVKWNNRTQRVFKHILRIYLFIYIYLHLLSMHKQNSELYLIYLLKLSELKRSHMCLQGKNVAYLALSHVSLLGSLLGRNSESLWLPALGDRGTPSPRMTKHPERFFVCWWPGSGMLQRDSSLPLIITPCSYSMLAPMILPPKIWKVSKATAELWDQ